MFGLQASVGEHDPQVANVISRGSGHDRVVDGLKQGKAVELGSGGCDVVAPGFGSRNRRAVDNSSSGRAVAVDAVGSGAQDRDLLVGNLLGTVEGELLVASADSGAAIDLHRHLTSGDEAGARDSPAQLAKAAQEMVS